MRDGAEHVALWRVPALRDLAILNLLAFTSFFVLLAALPVWAVDGGAHIASAGVVTTALLAATVACQLIVPAWLRALAPPRLLVVGLLALGLPAPLYLVSQALPWLVAVSAVRGVGFAIVTVVGAMLTVELAPPARRGEAVGLYGISIAIPNLTAVPAGATFALGGSFAAVAVVATIPILAVPLVGSLHGEGARAAVPTARGWGGVRAVAPACTVLAVATATGGGLVTFLPIARPDGAVTGLALLAFGVFGAASRWRSGRAADRSGTTRALLPAALGLCGAGGAVVALGLSAGGAPLLVGGAALAGLGYGGVQNLSFVAVLARAGPARTTSATAAWNASFDTGTAVGAWAVGAVAAAGPGLAAAYLGCAGLALLALPLAVVADRGG